jgi:hypothetical protein
MEIKNTYSFQVDSEIVKNFYETQNNYLIEYSKDIAKKYCIIYFSSNDIYYPNTEAAFRSQLISKNNFEWYKTRISIGHKHIFVRDIQKQFYLAGINSKLNSSQKLLHFLKDETDGYQTITVGSSSGGFASVTYGQLLNAVKIYSFNGGFEISSKLITSNERINPLIFRNKEDMKLRLWFDTRNFINNPSSIYYFQSTKSEWDLNQYSNVKDLSIHRIQFKNSRHGIPFLKTNLPFVLNCSTEDLQKMTGRIIHPLIFSFNTVGSIQTIFNLNKLLLIGLKKIYSRALLKFSAKN